MPPPAITVSLSKYAHIEILRAEIGKLTNDLKELEVQIRNILLEEERQRYLQTVHSIFLHLQPPAGAQEMPQILIRRNQIFEALQALQAALTALEAETAAAAHAVPTGGGPQSRAVPSAGMSAPRPAISALSASASPPRPAVSANSSATHPAVQAPGGPKRSRFDSFDEFRGDPSGGAKS